VLTKKQDGLEIFIPPKGFSLDLLPIIGFAVIWNGFLVMWYSIAILNGSFVGLFLAFFALGHLGVGLWLILQILFALFGQVWLHLDQEQISLMYQLFDLKYYRPQPAPRHQIIKLERTQTSYKTGSKGQRVEVKPQINIWAGTKKFRIGGGGLLSETELDWLAHELSNWLGLTISQVE
jgi:hypothetical protein